MSLVRAVEQMEIEIAELESKLAASEEARKTAETELVGLQCKYELMKFTAEVNLKACEAAEKLIEDSRKQKPFATCHNDGYWLIAEAGKVLLDEKYKCAHLNNFPPQHVYLQPPIPPELSEVMREMDELKRKLADERFEHRSYVGQMHERFNNETIALRKHLECMMENAVAMSALNPPHIILEASKLSEARKVPEGWKVVPIEPTSEMLISAQDRFEKLGYVKSMEFDQLYESMLSASPTYKEQP